MGAVVFQDRRKAIAAPRSRRAGSPGGARGGRLGDMQMAAGVAEHDPRRRLARGGRNGNRDRLPWRQYRFEPLDRHLLLHALLGGHRHVEAVGLIDVVDQGGRSGRRASSNGWSPELGNRAQLCYYARPTQGHHKLICPPPGPFPLRQWRALRSLEKESSCHFLAVKGISPLPGVGCIKAVATDAEAGA